MKKRILALLLALLMCLTMSPAAFAGASINSDADSGGVEQPAWEQAFSEWALNDLVIGDTYGIYPMSWYDQDMTSPIRKGQLISLMAKLRFKILKTDCVVKNADLITKMDKFLTVEKVLELFYSFLSGYEFTADIGLKDKIPIGFMKENGIYAAVEGELALSDICSLEQACVVSTRLVTYIYNKLEAASKGFFWSAKSGENTVYMLGSIHMASTDIYPFSNEILNAFQSSDALAVELNLYDTQGPRKIAELGMYTDGTTLKDHVSEQTYRKTVEIAAMFGYPEAVVSLLKPWYLYSLFAAVSSTDSGNTEEAVQAAYLGIDFNLTTSAYLSGKPVLEIEGYEDQANVLDSFSDELGEYLLNSAIDTINGILSGNISQDSEDMDLMLQLWQEGDTEAFKKYTSVEYEYPELYSQEDVASAEALLDEFVQKLITERDLKMADYIDSLLKSEGSNTYFIVVGSAHFISEYSVLTILGEMGYEVTQIK